MNQPPAPQPQQPYPPQMGQPMYPTPPPTPAPRKPWVARHKVLTGIGALLVLGVGSSLVRGGSGTTPATTAPVVASSTVAKTTSAQPATSTTSTTTTQAPAPASTTTTTAPAAPAAPALSPQQELAAQAAENYLRLSGFSRAGLIKQLSSEAGDGYSVKDATAAVDSLSIDWNEQAVRSAEAYLKLTAFLLELQQSVVDVWRRVHQGAGASAKHTRHAPGTADPPQR